MVEDIIVALSRIRGLFVLPRNSTFTYKGRAVDVKQVGQELGVRYVLRGSVRKAGDRARITAQLINSAAGINLWADRFEGSLKDIFDLQDQITTSVVGALLRSLEQAEIERAKRKPAGSLDAEVSPSPIEEPLPEFGIPLGARLKLLRASDDVGMSSPSTISATATPSPDGERRYLNVMFCELVCSTGTSAQLDAEEWRDLVSAYLDAASAAVTQMGGHVAKKIGDGLLAVFGYPVAHENDAERAVRAALSIQHSLAELNGKNAGTRRPQLQGRIGLDSGPAVVDATGEIFGIVANIAARVQALAEPRSIFVTSQVLRQAAGLFVVEERGIHTLRGVPEATALFRIVRASGGGYRADQRNLTPLVGRDEELSMLLRRWQRARQDEGQFVLIVGEPGLGKSRLLEEFRTRLVDMPHTWVEWSCSQLLQNTPLHPISEWGRQRFGGSEVPAERRLTDLESSLAQVRLDPVENVSLLAPLIGIPLPDERVPKLAPEDMRRRQLAALTNWVISGAKAQSVVLAVEDLHWADPTTLDVLRAIAERGALSPLLVVATARPEFQPSWGRRSHHSTISLPPLDREQVHRMVAELSARHALGLNVVDVVAARTGGVPLFIEEVTQLLSDRGEQAAIEEIPPTLQQSLMARLDRLGAAREVAQIGAVIGRDFSYRLLKALAGMDDAALQAALEKLADSDIVLVQGLPPESEYRFKHVLIQEAAYENLLKRRRQVLHRRVAEVLCDQFAATSTAEPEVLAHHFTQAGMTDAAIECWGKAGDQALRRSAFQEAIAHLGKAIEMADTQSGNEAAALPAAASPRLKLQTSLGQAMIHGRGYSAPETRAAFSRARGLLSGFEDPSERCSVLYGLWVNGYVAGEYSPCRENVDLLLREAENIPRSAEACTAARLNGMTHWLAGQFEVARAELERALGLFDPVRDADFFVRFAQDALVSIKSNLALSLWPLGEAGLACRYSGQAVARAGQIDHTATKAFALFQVIAFEALRRRPLEATRHAAALLDLSQTNNLPMFATYANFYVAWATPPKDRTVGMRAAIEDCRQLGLELTIPVFDAALAEAEMLGGETQAALEAIDAALANTERQGQQWFDAEIHRIRGEILLKRDPAKTDPAEAAFQTAIAVARQQKARGFELRAALSLAKLYQAAGRPAEAHAVLAPALKSFSSTPEFPEIVEAQTLLAALVT